MIYISYQLYMILYDITLSTHMGYILDISNNPKRFSQHSPSSYRKMIGCPLS